MLASLLLSSGAAVALNMDACAKNRVALWLTFIVAALQGLSLVIGFGRKAATHADYCRRFVDIEKKWRATHPTFDHCVALENEQRELEKEEPIPMPYLTTRTQIDLMRRDGYPKAEWPKLHWAKRLLAQYLPEMG